MIQSESLDETGHVNSRGIVVNRITNLLTPKTEWKKSIYTLVCHIFTPHQALVCFFFLSEIYNLEGSCIGFKLM